MQPHGVDLSGGDNAKCAPDLKFEPLDDDDAADEGRIIELLAEHIHVCRIYKEG